MNTLIATGVVYFSQGDEDAFFIWLNKIGCVREARGVGRDLKIELKTKLIADSDLRELVALFHRYNVDSKQLATFETKANAHWFRAPRSYWYSRVFEV